MRKNNDVYTEGDQGQKMHGDAASEETGASAGGEQQEAMSESDLQNRIAELEQEKEELTNRLMRLQADFDNFRKRSRAEKEEMVDYAAYDLVCRLLPVIDNLERACDATEQCSEGLAEGVTMITRQFKELLEKEGLQTIDCKGKPFNPERHDAVMREDSGDYPHNTVVEEFQKGYMMKDRVVRPSMVKVAVKE